MATSLRMAASVQRWSSAGRGRARICQVSSRCWPSDDEVVGGRGADGRRGHRRRSSRAPAISRVPLRAGGDERERLGAAGVLEEREGFAGEDVGVTGELEQGDGGVEVAQELAHMGLSQTPRLSG